MSVFILGYLRGRNAAEVLLVVGNIGLCFAGSTSLPEMLALGTKLSYTNFDWGKFPPPSLQKFRLLATIPDKTICDTCHILPKLSKTCHKPKKIPPCPPKSMLSVGGFVDRCFRDMNNIVRGGGGKGGGCFET